MTGFGRTGETAPSQANYFIGQNSYTDVAQYTQVDYGNLYQNIGVQYSSNSKGQLEYS